MIDWLMERIESFSWTMETTIPSFMLFGEYPYPKKEEEESDNTNEK